MNLIRFALTEDLYAGSSAAAVDLTSQLAIIISDPHDFLCDMLHARESLQGFYLPTGTVGIAAKVDGVLYPLVSGSRML